MTATDEEMHQQRACNRPCLQLSGQQHLSISEHSFEAAIDQMAVISSPTQVAVRV